MLTTRRLKIPVLKNSDAYASGFFIFFVNMPVQSPRFLPFTSGEVLSEYVSGGGFLMTDQEKQRIAVMRSLGESYNEIAVKLNLSVNTVKTFCRRNQLTGVRASVSEHEELSVTPITQCLLSAPYDGNSTDAETAEGKQTGTSAGRRDFKVTLEFSDEDDETAVTDIIQMLLRGR